LSELQVSSSHSTTLHSSWFIKFVECLFVVTAVYNSYNTLFLQPFTSLLPSVFGLLNPLMTITGLLFINIYPIYWHRKESKGNIDSIKLHALCRGILRYWLAISICTYGIAKIYGTQFAYMYSRNDSLVGDLSGFDLTWNYFGHSYTLSVIIAFLQIGGSVLLLFRRTTLLGAAILFPVMLNIFLINWLFEITAYAFLNSILYSLGLLYLLLLRWKVIKEFLFQSAKSLPQIRLGFVKYLLRFLAVAYPLGLIYYETTIKSPKTLVGKWRVDQMIRNGDTLNANAWLTDSTDWKIIYLEEFGVVVLNPNPYLVEKDRSLWGSYKYDSTNHNIKLILGVSKNKKDTLNVKSNIKDDKHMQWIIVTQKDTLLLQLSKVERKNNQ
jgi:hypothetical protein